ncbi:MAG TPA: class I adenylate-forming enzyme family protein, partial [Terriglobia bacterium]|nr:class I adenylate-forming enzyme family protein [Terriglobia bacterium]
MPRQSLLDYLEYFDRYGGDTACVHRRGYRQARWSYRQVLETARQFAQELEARGVGRGERVLLWGENCAEWVAAFWGTLLRGAVVVPLDRICSPEFAASVARQAGARLVVSSQELVLPGDSTPALHFENLVSAIIRHDHRQYPSPA